MVFSRRNSVWKLSRGKSSLNHVGSFDLIQAPIVFAVYHMASHEAKCTISNGISTPQVDFTCLVWKYDASFMKMAGFSKQILKLCSSGVAKECRVEIFGRLRVGLHIKFSTPLVRLLADGLLFVGFQWSSARNRLCITACRRGTFF